MRRHVCPVNFTIYDVSHTFFNIDNNDDIVKSTQRPPPPSLEGEKHNQFIPFLSQPLLENFGNVETLVSLLFTFLLGLLFLSV